MRGTNEGKMEREGEKDFFCVCVCVFFFVWVCGRLEYRVGSLWDIVYCICIECYGSWRGTWPTSKSHRRQPAATVNATDTDTGHFVFSASASLLRNVCFNNCVCPRLSHEFTLLYGIPFRTFVPQSLVVVFFFWLFYTLWSFSLIHFFGPLPVTKTHETLTRMYTTWMAFEMRYEGRLLTYMGSRARCLIICLHLLSSDEKIDFLAFYLNIIENVENWRR